MAYPISLDSFTPKVNGTDDVMAIDINELQSAIAAIEAKLGVNSSAVSTSHDYKIAALQTGKQDKLNFTPEDVSNKQTNLTASATKYPTVNAVNTGLATKEDVANKENTAIDTSTTKYPTVNLLKTVKDTIPVKATGAEINTGTDDAKFVTTKALAESNLPLHTATWSLVESDKEVAIGTALGGDWRIPGNRAIKIKKVGAYVDTAGTTGVTTIDINEAGTSILSTKITIDSGEKSSQTAATAPVISDTNIAADAILTFDVDGVSTTKPKGLKVYIEFTY